MLIWFVSSISASVSFMFMYTVSALFCRKIVIIFVGTDLEQCTFNLGYRLLWTLQTERCPSLSALGPQQQGRRWQSTTQRWKQTPEADIHMSELMFLSTDAKPKQMRNGDEPNTFLQTAQLQEKQPLFPLNYKAGTFWF